MKRTRCRGNMLRVSNGSFGVKYLFGLLFKFFGNFYSLLGKVWGIGFATRNADLFQGLHGRFSADAAMGGFVDGKHDYSVLELVIGEFLPAGANTSFQCSLASLVSTVLPATRFSAYS